MARSPAATVAPLLAASMLLAACTGAAARRPLTPDTRGALPGAGRPGVVPPGATPEAAACITATRIEPGQTVRGSTATQRDLFHASCAYGASSPDAVYTFHLNEPSRVSVRVAGSYDTVVHLRSACGDEDTELACNDDAGDERHSAVEAALPPGDYYVFVDGYASEARGFYSLSLTTTPRPSAAPLRTIERLPAGEGATVRHVPGQRGITGTVTFAKRAFTPRGLTQATTDAPAPHFVVEAVSATGHVIAATETDDLGGFRIDVPANTEARIRAITRTAWQGNDIRVISDAGSERPYEVSSPLARLAGDEHIALRAGVGGVEPAGAFNILAQFVRYLPYVQRGFNRPLPPLFAFWRRGNNRSLPMGTITAFLLRYHRHPGSYALQIQGGDPGREDASDSDQFDDPVILHEFGHFIVHTMAGHFTIGGQHQDGELHFPGQALDEGAATAMGCAVVGDGHYWDTAGLEPTGGILVDDDMEGGTLPDRGIGSQNTAQALLWDMIDGAENVVDRDNDGVAIGLSGVMRIYASFREDPIAFPGIHTMVERAVDLNLMTREQASRLVRTPVNHGFAYPLAPADQWPQDITLPGEATGRVDGQTQPAPSGGRNVPWNGLDSIRTYRLRVQRRQVVTIDLEVQGPGTQESGTNLALNLYDRNLEPIARAQANRPRLQIVRMLDPGTYIIFVRDGDVAPQLMRLGTPGNRANFTLRVH